MRNRGYMAHYLRHLEVYNAVGFGIGTALTFLKESCGWSMWSTRCAAPGS